MKKSPATGSKRIIGFVFLILALLLLLAWIGQLPAFYKSFADLFRLFKGDVGSYEKGSIMGSSVYWIAHILLTIFLWMVGRKLSRKIAVK